MGSWRLLELKGWVSGRRGEIELGSWAARQARCREEGELGQLFWVSLGLCSCWLCVFWLVPSSAQVSASSCLDWGWHGLMPRSSKDPVDQRALWQGTWPAEDGVRLS